jgi:hypothetical protein
VIPNANLELANQGMTANIVALNANHNKIEKSHVEV